MKTKVILIISKSLMQFGRDGIIFGQTSSDEINPATFDVGHIPDYCIKDMERLMFLDPDTYCFEVYRNFGPALSDLQSFASQNN